MILNLCFLYTNRSLHQIYSVPVKERTRTKLRTNYSGVVRKHDAQCRKTKWHLGRAKFVKRETNTHVVYSHIFVRHCPFKWWTKWSGRLHGWNVFPWKGTLKNESTQIKNVASRLKTSADNPNLFDPDPAPTFKTYADLNPDYYAL